MTTKNMLIPSMLMASWAALAVNLEPERREHPHGTFLARCLDCLRPRHRAAAAQERQVMTMPDSAVQRQFAEHVEDGAAVPVARDFGASTFLPPRLPSDHLSDLDDTEMEAARVRAQALFTRAPIHRDRPGDSPTPSSAESASSQGSIDSDSSGNQTPETDDPRA